MQETWVQSLGREDPMEKEMAIYSSILAWRIPWTEEPGELQSLGRRRIGYYLATEQQQPPVVRTWCFHCWGLGSVPGQGTVQSHSLLLSPLKGPQLDLQIRSYLFSFTNYVWLSRPCLALSKSLKLQLFSRVTFCFNRYCPELLLV